jgi:hypothetical protein
MNQMLTPLASFNRATGRIAVGEAELDYENALWLLETFLEEVNSALDTNQESEWAMVKTAYLIGAINSLLEQDDNDRSDRTSCSR